MLPEEIKKSKFAQINNRRYYFSNGIVSLPFAHPYLKSISERKQKKPKKQKIKKYLLDKKNGLLRVEKQTLLKNERLSLLRNILLHNPIYYSLNSLKRSAENNQNINFLQTTRSYILGGFWK